MKKKPDYFKENRIKIRKLPLIAKKHFQHCKFSNKHSFQQALKKIKASLLNKNDIFYKCTLLLKKDPIETTKERLIRTNIPPESFPMDLKVLEEMFNEQHLKIRVLLEKSWRTLLIEELKETLFPHFNLYETDSKQYFGSDLERLLRKFELLFKENIEKFLLLENLENYQTFLNKFLNPTILQKKNLQPLIKLTLKVNHIHKSQTIQIILEPTFSTILKTLTLPLEMLKETISSIGCLDKSLLPLIGLRYRICVKDNEKIQNTIEWIKIELERHSKFLEEILKKFEEHIFLLKKSTETVMKKIFGDGDEEVSNSLDLLNKVEKVLKKYQTSKGRIQMISINNQEQNLFFIDITEIKEKMLQKIEKVVNISLEKMKAIFQNIMQKSVDEFNIYIKKVSNVPQNEMEIMELRQSIEKKGEFLGLIEQRSKYLNSLLEVFNNNFYEIPVYFLKTKNKDNKIYLGKNNSNVLLFEKLA